MFQGTSIVGSSNLGQPDSSSGREELLYGARQPESKGKGGVRSAAEIRSAYGRSSTRYHFVSITTCKKFLKKQDMRFWHLVLLWVCTSVMQGCIDFWQSADHLRRQSWHVIFASQNQTGRLM